MKLFADKAAGGNMDEQQVVVDGLMRSERLANVIGQFSNYVREDIASLVEGEQIPGSFGDLIKRSVEMTAAHELFNKPMHPYTQGLMASFPALVGPKETLTGIPGSPPNMLEPPSGCRFHPRCPKAIAQCSLQQPTLREVEPGHFVACHLY